jgi:uncharacterized membrane-anchored protein YhcB (DUF1043 family)
MVEPKDFSEIYLDAANIKESFTSINALCDQEIYNFRFGSEKVKKLSKYQENLKKVKESIDTDLENIQTCFDNIETFVIVYLHNLDKVKQELIYISEQRQEEIDKMTYNIHENNEKYQQQKKNAEKHNNDDQQIDTLIGLIDKTDVKECEFE